MDRKLIEEISLSFLKDNYNYIYLTTMLNKAKCIENPGATLITGSSYALSGIICNAWNNAVSCSMSSQDLYYDFKCAYDVVSSYKSNMFSKCFIIKGYYASCHDISSSLIERERVITNVYYPIFQDSHNWLDPTIIDVWSNTSLNENIPDDMKPLIEKLVSIMINYQGGNYYSKLRPRKSTIFDLGNKRWSELSEDEKIYMGEYRAKCHNKLFKFKNSILENKEIIKDYVHFLYLNEITPIFVIPPFVKTYNDYILKDMKESLYDMLENVVEDIHFIDFNDTNYFNDDDFIDTDHLNETGAKKMSFLLADLYGR